MRRAGLARGPDALSFRASGAAGRVNSAVETSEKLFTRASLGAVRGRPLAHSARELASGPAGRGQIFI